jgi:peptidoglycan/xylan/chitin deacetylase (PgdA/CDA1 family)
MTKKIIIDINFDSFNYANNFASGYSDPSFFSAFDRFAEIVGNFDVKFSIFIIGKDLENKSYFSRVREWSKNGHEIGNHSYRHLENFGGLSAEGISEEIAKSHDLIFKCTDKEPKGFISPGWSTSSAVIKKLIDLNYVYDTSLFPSFFFYANVFKVLFNRALTFNFDRLYAYCNRRDWFLHLVRPRFPHFVDSGNKRLSESAARDKALLILPMPTKNRFYPPCWHTLGYVFGWNFLKKYIASLLDKHDTLYYLMHPADFVSMEDLARCGFDLKQLHFERMNIPIAEKLHHIRDIFSLFRSYNVTFSRMIDVASDYIENQNKFA